MLAEITYPAAFVVGLLGGAHCFGMCGGIVGALALGLPDEVRASMPRLVPYLLAYNLGRIASYTVAGGLMGGVGALAANMLAVHQAQRGLQVLAALFMLALGLYLAGWWQGLTRVERLGGRLWRYLEPLGRRWLPVRSRWQALGLGLVWGWLPCGLVYSVLVWSITAGGFLRGALLMCAFGLGTLPALLAMGATAARVSALVRAAWVRQAAGALVMLFGAFLLLQALGYTPVVGHRT